MKVDEARGRVLQEWRDRPMWRGDMAVSRTAYDTGECFVFEVGLGRYINDGDEGGAIPNCPQALVDKATGTVTDLPWYDVPRTIRGASRITA